jgi:hypothetical protein
MVQVLQLEIFGLRPYWHSLPTKSGQLKLKNWLIQTRAEAGWNPPKIF